MPPEPSDAPDPIAAAVATLGRGGDLDDAAMSASMRALVSGDADVERARDLLMALRDKGESAAELAAAVRVLMRFAVTMDVPADDLLDTCGTGGDGAGTFNVSTGAALAAAGAGARVAKHGNRAVSSTSGSADVLEAAGVTLELDAPRAAECLARTGIAFLFAPCFHPAMKHVAAARKAVATRTIFNLLGPLLNPARARCRVIGVFDRKWLEPMAETAAATGVRRVLTVHSDDGLDEISSAAPTRVFELIEGERRRYTVTPEDFGQRRADAGELRVSSVADGLARLRAVLAGEQGAATDAVVANAGAALYVAGRAPDLRAGAEMARRALQQGAAAAKLEALVATSRELAA